MNSLFGLPGRLVQLLGSSAAETPDPAASNPSFRTLVLAVDGSLRQRYTEAATNRGHAVVTRANTWTARFAVSRRPPEILVVEWPDETGHRRALTRFLHSIDIHHCITLAITDPARPTDVADALAAGAGDAIPSTAPDEAIRTRLEVMEAQVVRRSSRTRATNELETDYQRLLQATGTESDGLFDWDLEEGVFNADRRLLGILEIDNSDEVNHPRIWLDAVHPDDRQHLESVIRATRDGALPLLEHHFRLAPNGDETPKAMVRAQVMRNEEGRAVRIVGRLSRIEGSGVGPFDTITSVLHDPLTRLPNRLVLIDRLKSMIRRAQDGGGHSFAVLFFDLNRFKNVNDGLGHLCGDQLLRAFSERVRTVCRPEDVLARFAGDEFVIVADGVATSRDAAAMASRIHQAMASPFDLAGTEVFASVSIGIAIWDPSYLAPEDLLRDADTAMYRAKAQGRDMTAVFDEAMRRHAIETLELENDLRRGVARREFRPYYQPIITADGLRIAGFEALVRWHHPDRGLLPPARFIRVAEELGLIIAIDRHVAEEACQQLRAWRAAYRRHEKLSMAVNISSSQFVQPDLVPQMDLILRQSGIYGSALKVEVTESVLMENAQHAEDMLEQLRKLDIGISIDDFGTGYSSLAYLRRFEIDTLKIDYSFVSRMLFDQESAEIVRTIVHLARNLGKESVAEGVETRSQFEALQRMGVDLIQGYYVSPPIPAEGAQKLLEMTSNSPNHLQTILANRLRTDTVVNLEPELDDDLDDLFSETD
jgi:diguanylate cyclase (GGDEF)-like protein